MNGAVHPRDINLQTLTQGSSFAVEIRNRLKLRLSITGIQNCGLFHPSNSYYGGIQYMMLGGNFKLSFCRSTSSNTICPC